ncbi:hypothetical protein GCM10023231_39360 [Olivibacter ginsenosidimutans]|uniref:Uncharacterized protein n=1 Tax=Olivibacter ginsenosidimutans TaxID=1176537 RepID=A0ABP9CCY1_9SPHI
MPYIKTKTDAFAVSKSPRINPNAIISIKPKCARTIMKYGDRSNKKLAKV